MSAKTWNRETFLPNELERSWCLRKNGSTCHF